LALNCIAATNTVIKKETLEKSIVKAADNVLSIQENDGRWAANIRINPRETAYFIVTAKYLKIPGLDEDIKKSADWLVQHVNNDNGWGFFDKGGKSDISITAIVYLALKLAGVDENSIVMKKSFAFIENNGGLKASDIFCKTFYSFLIYIRNHGMIQNQKFSFLHLRFYI
jgi:squalene cyclase